MLESGGRNRGWSLGAGSVLGIIQITSLQPFPRTFPLDGRCKTTVFERTGKLSYLSWQYAECHRTGIVYAVPAGWIRLHSVAFLLRRAKRGGQYPYPINKVNKLGLTL